VVEQFAVNEWVAGSSPAVGAIVKSSIFGDFTISSDLSNSLLTNGSPLYSGGSSPAGGAKT
jgi:hypothetical protein